MSWTRQAQGHLSSIHICGNVSDWPSSNPTLLSKPSLSLAASLWDLGYWWYIGPSPVESYLGGPALYDSNCRSTVDEGIICISWLCGLAGEWVDGWAAKCPPVSIYHPLVDTLVEDTVISNKGRYEQVSVDRVMAPGSTVSVRLNLLAPELLKVGIWKLLHVHVHYRGNTGHRGLDPSYAL